MYWWWVLRTEKNGTLCDKEPCSCPAPADSSNINNTVYLYEVHEEADVLGGELLQEVVDGLVHVLRQRVMLAHER